MKEIKLTRGMVAIVDDEHFDWLNTWKWYAHKGRNTFYAARHIKEPGQKRVTIFMHILLTGGQRAGKVVDHKDGNGLNNTDDNIRVCSYSQNQTNSPDRKLGAAGFRGVTIGKGKKKYIAQIRKEGKKVNLGSFYTAEEASDAYNKAAALSHGEFAAVREIKKALRVTIDQ